MMDFTDKNIVIVGATASGKSHIAVEIAKQLNREIISLDSMQVYKSMEIGTGVIALQERQGIIHHLLSYRDPIEKFSVKQFKDDVYEILERDRFQRYVLVGGTGLYTNAIIDNYSFAPTNVNARQEIIDKFNLDEAQPDFNKVQLAYQYLYRQDKRAAEKIDPMNVRRIIRALESLYLSQKFSDVDGEIQPYSDPHIPSILIGLRYEREVLRQRISRRIYGMLDSGWVQEVENLYPIFDMMAGPPKHAIGYQLIIDWIKEGKKLSRYDSMVEQVINRTIQFSRRQRKWFEKDPRILWVDCDTFSNTTIVDRIIKEIKEIRDI